MVVGHIVLFFLAGFCMFYWKSKGGRADPFLVILQMATIVGGVYFLGWWAVLTIILGMVIGPALARG